MPPQSTGVEDLISKCEILRKKRQRLQHQYDDTLCKMGTCDSDTEAIKKIKKGEKITTKEVKLCKKPLNVGEYVTNCDVCQTACHDPCSIESNDGKMGCAVMKNGKCTVCPRKCSWTKHTNNNCRYEYQEEDVTISMDYLSEKYKFDSRCRYPEAVIEQRSKKLQQQLSGLQAQLNYIRTTEQNISKQLESTIQSYNTQIDSVRRQMTTGYQERIKVLEKLRDHAMQYL